MSDLTQRPEKLAWHPIVVFAASVLVLSVSLNNAGFKSVVDAWAASMVANIENKPNKQTELAIQQLEHRIEQLEKLSHESTTKKEGD